MPRKVLRQASRPHTWRVALGMSIYIVDLLSGCMDHNHDMLARGSYPRDGEGRGFVRGPFEDTTDQDSETQRNGHVKQNLERSSVISPVEDTIQATRIISASKAKKMTAI